MTGAAANNQIGMAGAGNVVSGNNFGVINEGGSGNRIQGNLIGTDTGGTVALGNNIGSGTGLGWANIYSASANTFVGGDQPDEGNVITGAAGPGIWVRYATAAGTQIRGNFIGTNSSGGTWLGNSGAGIFLGADNVTVGGTTPGARNVIAANDIGVYADVTTNSTIQGNYIGTDPTGNAVLSQRYGVFVGGLGGTNLNLQIGGTTPGSGNTISGSTEAGIGILFDSNGVSVQCNRIGVGADGATAISNARGVEISYRSNHNTIGGAAAGAGNRIAENTGPGVIIDGATTTGNTLRGNLIYANNSGGPQVVLANGANAGEAAPVITGALGGASTRVFGTLSAAPNTAYAIDFFDSPSGTQAKRFLGSTTVTTDLSEFALIDVPFSISSTFGSRVTAVATSLVTGNSSALMPSYVASAAVITGIPSGLNEGTPITANALTATDPGNGNVNAFNWSVTRNGLPFALPDGSIADETAFHFIPTDEGNDTFTLIVTTSKGLEAPPVTASFVTQNVTPEILINGMPSTSLANVPIHLTATVTDPGAEDVQTITWQVYRNGVSVGALASGVNLTNFSFTPTGNGVWVVQVSSNDGDGGIGTRSSAVLVNGAAPLATINAVQGGDEGRPIHATVSHSEILDADNLDFAWTVFRNGLTYAVGSQPFIDFTPDDNGDYTISLRATSATAIVDVEPSTVHVSNVSPVVSITGAIQNASAGNPVTINAIISDPGNADTHTVEWRIVSNNGQAPITGTGSSFTFTPGAAGTYVAQVIVRDDDGGLGTNSMSFDVIEAALQVSVIGVPPSSPEGTAITATTLIFNGFGATFTYAWSVTKNGDPYVTASTSSFVFRPDDNGTYLVIVRVTASDGRVGSDSALVEVTNVATTPMLHGVPASSLEGMPITATADATDPGSADSISYSWTILKDSSFYVAGSGPDVQFIPDDNATYTISLTATDDDGGTGTTSAVVTILNVPPMIAIESDPTTTSPDGITVGLKALIDDAGAADTLNQAGQISWNVTRNGVFFAGGSGPAFSFTRIGGGVYAATLTVDDLDGGVVSTTTLIVMGDAAANTITIDASTPSIAGVNQVVVQSLGGDDRIQTSPLLMVPVVLDGGDGNDTLSGGSGDDLIIAGLGNNVVQGNGGDDTLVGGGSDVMAGGLGNDTYVVQFSVVSLTETGTGVDTIDLSLVPFGVTFNLGLQDGTAQTVNAAAAPGSTLHSRRVRGAQRHRVCRQPHDERQPHHPHRRRRQRHHHRHRRGADHDLRRRRQRFDRGHGGQPDHDLWRRRQ